MKKGSVVIIVVVLIVILLIGGVIAYFLTQSQNKTMLPGTVNDSSSNATKAIEEEAEADIAELDDLAVVNVSAKNYAYTPQEIRVLEGETVKIVLDVTEGTHDLVIDEFNVRTDVINAGSQSEVTFVADKAGEFEFYCSLPGHRQLGMVGKLIVE